MTLSLAKFGLASPDHGPALSPDSRHSRRFPHRPPGSGVHTVTNTLLISVLLHAITAFFESLSPDLGLHAIVSNTQHNTSHQHQRESYSAGNSYCLIPSVQRKHHHRFVREPQSFPLSLTAFLQGRQGRCSASASISAQYLKSPVPCCEIPYLPPPQQHQPPILGSAM